MILREGIPLSELTTLKVGGPANVVYTIETVEDLQTALASIRERGLSYVVLGQGSNVLPPDEGYTGAVLLMQMQGSTYEDRGDHTLVSAGAGMSWDALVRECAQMKLWGIENLAGIPGTVGAAPVQNIGAYGTELMSVIAEVEAMNAAKDEHKIFTPADCAFSYRDSRFKHEPEWIITRVTLRLTKEGEPRIGYADLQKAQEQGVLLSTLVEIGEAVRNIRSLKFPDLTLFGTAGSFFKNPILTQEAFAELTQKYGAVPSFPMADGVKVPLAFILDRVLQLKGYKQGHTFLFGNQPLVLVAEQGAMARDIDALAQEIESKVLEATGIRIEREVRDLAFHEYHL